MSSLCALGFLMALFALLPLPHASPADPLGIAGIYDSADLDESTEVVTSMVGIVEGLLPGACNPLDLVARIVSPCNAPFPRASVATTFSVRAPPAA